MSDLSARTKRRLQGLAAKSPNTRQTPTFTSAPRSPTAAGAPSFAERQSSVQPSGGKATDAPGMASPAPDSKKRSRRSDDNADTAPTPAVGVIPSITLEEMGGLQRELPVIRELIELPIKHPHLFTRIGAEPPRGVLMHGPPGCGKTKLAHAIAGSLQVPLFYVSAPEIVQGISGDSEAKVRTLFQDAISVAPSIIFIDEIETIAGRRDQAQREMEKRIVAQLLTCMDQLGLAWREHNKVVCVLGATNRPEAIDSALRRAGRFDREIPLGIPSVDERQSILKVLTSNVNLAPDVDFWEIANMTPGYVGADLHLLIKEACVVAIRRKYRQLNEAGELNNVASDLLLDFSVSFEELKKATKRVQPSAMREGFTTIPNVTWADVGALEDARAELVRSVVQPIRTPKLHKWFGMDKPTGVLLYGPPGCGKTLVAKAIANESGANFISIKGPELLNKFVGESERSVRMVFARGRASAPCVLFFDELDALAPRRGSDKANPSSERVVNQLLTEMDGVEGRAGVYVIAATNRPDMIDPAMRRAGRLEKHLYVGLPTPAQRVSILRTVSRKFPLAPDVDLEALGHSQRLTGFSGADLAALVREASLTALQDVHRDVTDERLRAIEQGMVDDDLDADAIGVEPSAAPIPVQELPHVSVAHFAAAALKVRPSVSAEDQRQYEEIVRQLRDEAVGE
jgi:ribosome biogenesis ATPase